MINLFRETKIPLTNYIIENCITTFSIENEANSKLLHYETRFIREMLHQERNISHMETLSIVYDFLGLLETNIEENPLLAARKIYAVAFYLDQFIDSGNLSILKDIRIAFQILLNAFQQGLDLSSFAAAGCAYALLMLTPKCLSVKDMSINNSDLFHIENLALQIAKVPNLLNNHTFPIFQSFFLSSIFIFNSNEVLKDDENILFQDILSFINWERWNGSTKINFISLCGQLIAFLNDNNFSKDTQVKIYSFLADLSLLKNNLSEYLIDTKNLKNFTYFLSRICASTDTKYQTLSVKKHDDVKQKEIEQNIIIKEKRFVNPIFEEFSKLNEQLNEPLKNQFKNDHLLQKIYEATFTICNSDMERRLRAHARFIICILSLKNKSRSLGIFLSVWFKKFIMMDQDNAISAFGDFKIINLFLKIASGSIQLPELSKNINETLVFMTKNCQKFDFLQTVLLRFEKNCSNLSINIHFANCLYQCASINQQKMLTIFKQNAFDEKISNLLIILRSYHLSNENSEEVLTEIKKTRLILFFFIDKLFHLNEIRNYFIHSDIFLQTICQLIFEQNVDSFAFHIIGYVPKCCLSSDPSLHTIINFFQKLFERIRTHESNDIVELDSKILSYIAQYFSYNPNTCANAFIQTNFFSNLSEFVIKTQSNEDLLNLIRIFQNCALVDIPTKKNLFDLNPFQQISKLIESCLIDEKYQQTENNIDIKSKLWGIICGVECPFMDKVRPFKYSAPLTLIFLALKRNKTQLVQFLQFIYECCNADLDTAFEVNNTDLPSHVISIFHEYRKQDTSDELFEVSLKLITLLSKYYIKQTDLITIFQSLTLLPVDLHKQESSIPKRPFYTIEILKSLADIFDSINTNPTSFITSTFSCDNRENNTNSLMENYIYINDPFVTFPTIELIHPLSDLSFVIDINIRKESLLGERKEILFITDNNYQIAIWFSHASQNESNVLFYITLNNIKYDVDSNPTNTETIFEENFMYQINFDKWIQICGTINQNDFSFFINGAQQCIFKIPSIQLNGPIDGYLGKNFSCSISSFYLFSLALDLECIALLAKLDKMTTTTFDPIEKNDFKPLFDPLFSGKLHDNAIYIFNAACRKSSNFLANIAFKYQNTFAQFTGQSFSYPPPPKFLLRSIGGISTLFPLFAQVDQPFCSEFLPAIISVLASALNDSSVNQEEFFQINGFQIISHLISCSQLSNITKDFISKVFDLFNILDFLPLIGQMFKYFFFNVQLWIYTSIDLQIYLYSNVLMYFSGMTNQKKQYIISNFLNFTDILLLIKACLWSKHASFSLLDKPKYNTVTNMIEAERPNDLSTIRKLFWDFASIVSEVQFSKYDAQTLCLYSFENDDIQTCVETIKFLIHYIRNRNPILIQVLKKKFHFQKFFSFILSPNEELRIQCLHIFYLFSQEDLEFLLEPYKKYYWTLILCKYINNRNFSITFLEHSFGYLFGLFNSHGVMEFKISKALLDTDEFYKILNALTFSYYEYLPITLMAISNIIHNTLAFNYINLLEQGIMKSRHTILVDNLTKIDNWYLPFVYFIISRIDISWHKNFYENDIISFFENQDSAKDDESDLSMNVFDKTVSTGLYLLSCLLVDSLHTENSKGKQSLNIAFNDNIGNMLTNANDNAFRQIRMILSIFSLDPKIGIDLNYLFGLILISCVKNVLMNPKEEIYQNHQDLMAYIQPLATAIFEYLFMISKMDSFHIPDFEPKDKDPQHPVLNSLPKKPSPRSSKFDVSISNLSMVSQIDASERVRKRAKSEEFSSPKIKYEELLNLESINDKNTTCSFMYSTRTKNNGEWADIYLATLFCDLFKLYPELLNCQSVCFYFSYIIGIGLSHPLHFSKFCQYIPVLTGSEGPLHNINGKFNEYQAKLFLNYYSGIIKSYFTGENNSDSHQCLFRETTTYKNQIKELLKYDFNWGMSVESFETCFQANNHHFAYQAIEKFTNENEQSVIQATNAFSKMINKNLVNFKSSNSSNLSNELAHNTGSILNSNPQNNDYISDRHKKIMIQLMQLSIDIKHNNKAGLKKYINTWKVLSGERGPWQQPEIDIIHHWKLNNSTQGITLRRGLMTENFKFDDHKMAALLRDTGNKQNAAEEYQKYLKQTRVTKFMGNNSIFEIGEDKTHNENIEDNDENTINQEKRSDIIISLNAKLVSMKQVISGTFILTNEKIIFDSAKYNEKYIDIYLDSITAILFRRYLLMDTSIEVFTTTHSCFFFEFVEGQRVKVIKELKKVKKYMKNLNFFQTSPDNIKSIIQTVQDRWVKGYISNFDYLMTLNIFSGRTYNDLAQYPVFPWVLSDYEGKCSNIENNSNESESEFILDLEDSDSYRDLSIPIGAYTHDRLNLMQEKMKIKTDEDNSAYLYGSFYSSAAVVIGYFIRMEPFTTLHINLQSGRFDNPERLFFSLPRSWISVTTVSMDFRELTPEFFYLPDFLINHNNFDLGKNVKDVELPRWAKSPRDFIEKNRKALESPIVSNNLHKWIDMIFGVTSRGEQAAQINNIYNPLFYSDNITNEEKNNEEKRTFRIEFVACFGQAPNKLFKDPHPQRVVLTRKLKPELYSIFSINNQNSPNKGILSMRVNKKYITIVNSQFEAILLNYSPKLTEKSPNLIDRINPFSNKETNRFEIIKSEYLPINQNKKPIDLSEEDYISLTRTIKTFKKIVLYSTPWDTSFSIFVIGEGLKHTKRLNVMNISSLAISKERYITASYENTITIWNNDIHKQQIPISILFGHRSTVMSVDISEECDIIVSVAHDKSISTASLMSGQFLKIVQINDGHPLLVTISNIGTICVSVLTGFEERLIKVFDINLNFIDQHAFNSSVICWCIFSWYDGSEYICVSFKNKLVQIFSLPHFELIWELPKGVKNSSLGESDITSIAFVKDHMSLLLGTSNGKIFEIALEE